MNFGVDFMIFWPSGELLLLSILQSSLNAVISSASSGNKCIEDADRIDKSGGRQISKKNWVDIKS